MSEATHPDAIEVHFVGGGIQPQVVRVSDLADVLRAVEVLVQSAVLNAHEHLEKDDIVLALTAVENGSVGLRFEAPRAPVVVPTFERTAADIERQRYDLIAREGVEALRKISAFNRKHNCVAEFRTTRQRSVLARVSPHIVIPAPQRVRIQTTVYGHVSHAGGKEPNVHLDLLSGRTIICSGSQAKVKALAERLYEMVGIAGTAECDVVTLDIYDLEIDEILPYRETPITDAFRELAEAVNGQYDGVDAIEFVRSIRSEDSEE